MTTTTGVTERAAVRHKKVVSFTAIADTRKQVVVCYAMLEDGTLYVSMGDDQRSDWEEVMPVPGTARRAELDSGG